MTTCSRRAVNAVSMQEMIRRWSAVRANMRAENIDALVIQNSSDWVGGYIRWFTNRPATNGYPTSAVFPVEGDITIIEQGPFNGLRIADDGEFEATGVRRIRMTPSYPSVAYTGGYDAEIAVEELRRLDARRVALIVEARCAMPTDFLRSQCISSI